MFICIKSSRATKRQPEILPRPARRAGCDNSQSEIQNPQLPEWRIHFHVPLHAPAAPPFENTNDHLLGVLDLLAANPEICSHLEMETYTWEVLPPELKSRSVVEQLAAEYAWTLARLADAANEMTYLARPHQVQV